MEPVSAQHLQKEWQEKKTAPRNKSRQAVGFSDLSYFAAGAPGAAAASPAGLQHLPSVPQHFLPLVTQPVSTVMLTTRLTIPIPINNFFMLCPLYCAGTPYSMFLVVRSNP